MTTITTFSTPLLHPTNSALPTPAAPLPSAPVAAPREATAHPRTNTAQPAPLLLLFGSQVDGRSRRVEGFVSHALQRRGNHAAFRVRVIAAEARPDLFERFAINEMPTVLVIDDKRVVRRLEGNIRPGDLDRELADWLR